VQATISAFDEPSRTGRVLLDDGQELSFDAGAFAASRMLAARLGQRVELTVADHGGQQRITGLRLITFR
jgi:hypothetical protein